LCKSQRKGSLKIYQCGIKYAIDRTQAFSIHWTKMQSVGLEHIIVGVTAESITIEAIKWTV